MKIKPRRDAVAKIANCNRLAPIAATENAVWRDCLDHVDRAVLEAVCRRNNYSKNPCFYWKHDGIYYYDDPAFGDVVPVLALGYEEERGLYRK